MTAENSYLGELILEVSKVVKGLIPIAFALGLLFFFWGMAQYIFKAGDEKAKTEGRNRMVQGVIALFVMTMVWGLVYLLGSIVGTELYRPADPGLKTTPSRTCIYDNTLGRQVCF